MTHLLKPLQKDFLDKVNQLEDIKNQLKNEFVGIDYTIDDIVDSIRSWYTMSSIQDRPAVINLWGLTGVGKTSLILRLMELIDFSDKTYRLDLGEKDGNMSFRNTISDLCENKEDEPIVILLDEFQHARTLQGILREEIQNDKNRMVWELIDSGKLSYTDWKRGLLNFEDVALKMKRLLQSGIKVDKGIVTAGAELYKDEMDAHTWNDDEPVRFLPKDEYENIIYFAGDKMDLKLKKDVEDEVLKMNGRQTVEFMFRVIRLSQRPSIKSFTKALIVILGNIDEAYTMSSNYSSEISADEFYEQSLKITLPDMKSALRMRFRDEQIARLGNTHIIYPALSASAYRQIIDLELEKISIKTKKQFGITMSFDPEVKDILYKEGVFPTQGARPLLTTIRSIIGSRISIYLNRILKNQLNTDHLHVYLEEETQLACGFYENEVLKFTYSDTLHLNLESLRKPKRDEMQAIAAVHESGHAVISSVLLHNIPEMVVTVTADNDAAGFVYSKPTKDFLSRNELLYKAAMYLGGITAEELVFGEDHVTAGAASDLTNATSFIMRMLKHNGMGQRKITFAKSTTEESMLFHDITAAENEAMELLEEAKSLALQTLKKERKLLLVLADHLSEHSRMMKAELTEKIKDHAVTKVITDHQSHFYRDKLKAQIETASISASLKRTHPIQMNKNKA